jgi:hypothetical protein
MSLSKRLRFEILRRDNHTCRYCGQAAPKVPLTVDHVIPEALGGTTTAGNLVTACQDCNSGKTSTAPDGPLVDDVQQIDLQWGRAIRTAGQRLEAERDQIYAYERAVYDLWTKLAGHDRWLPSDWAATVDRLYATGLPASELIEAVYTAVCSRTAADRWRYFCGIAWKRVAAMQELAKTLLEAGEIEGTAI